MSWGQKCESFWNSPLCHEGSEALRVGVVARPQGALAHGTLFPVGSERSLPIGLCGEGEARDTVGPLLRGSQPWEHSAPRARRMVTGPALVCERNCASFGVLERSPCGPRPAWPDPGGAPAPAQSPSWASSRASSSVIGPSPFDGCWSPWVFSVLCVCV